MKTTVNNPVFSPKPMSALPNEVAALTLELLQEFNKNSNSNGFESSSDRDRDNLSNIRDN